MPVVRFEVPGTPQAQPRATQYTDPRTGRRRAFTRKLKDPLTGKMTREHPSVAWRRLTQLWARTNAHGEWPIDKDQAVGLILQFAKLKPERSHSADWVTKPDFDNMAKAVADALTGLAYHDDSQVTRSVQFKDYAVDSWCKVVIVWGESLVAMHRRMHALIQGLK